MKKTAYLCFLLILSALFLEVRAQDRFSLERPPEAISSFNDVRALVMGVSSYKNLPLEKQLEFASDDAMAFYKFLLSRPDIVQPENIVALFNEEATNKTKIKTILYNLLVKESQANDLVIVYFAGHGDVQNFNQSAEEGFLLLHGVSRDGDYMAPGNDVIEISELQKYISLAPKGVKVLLITDACRSGKLISSQKAASRVLGALIQEWEDTYKLVSCQPNQVSYENKRWGDGHGVFSYYLLYGLRGLADKNDDLGIQFYELFDFVKEKVQEETNHKQIPKAKGDETVTFFPVDPDMKKMAKSTFPENDDNLKEQDKGGDTDHQYLYYGIKGPGENYFYNIPSDKYYLLRRFEQLVEKGILVPEDVEESAQNPTEIKVTGKTISRPHDQNTFAVDISKDGKYIATGGREDMIKLTDAQSGDLIKELPHSGVKGLAFAPDGNHLVSGAWDNKIKIWDIKTGRLVKSVVAHEDDIQVITFSRDGALMATGGDGPNIKIWKTRNWEIISSFKKGNSDEINSIVFTPDGKSIITAGSDGKIVIQSVETGKIKDVLYANSPVYDLELIEPGNQLIAATGNGYIRAYSSENYTLEAEWDLPLSSISQIETDPGGNYILAAGKEHQLIIWDAKNERKVYQTVVPRGVTGIALNAFHEKAAVVMYGGHCALFNIANMLPPMSDNAYDNYRILTASDELAHIQGRIKGYYCSALQSYATDILAPFINGRDILPSINELQKARTYLHYASKIYKKEDIISNRIKIKQNLLDIFETLVTNQFSNLPNAVSKIQQIIKEQPDASYTHNTLSVIYRRLNELQKAKDAGKIAATRIPEWTEPKANLGKAYFNEGSYDKAIKEFEKIVNIRPDLAKGYKNLGDVYTFLGNFSEANDNYEKAHSRDSMKPALYLSMAKFNMMKGNINEAEKILRTSIQLNPDYSETRLLLSKLYHYRFLKYFGERNKIREDLLEKALETLKNTTIDQSSSYKKNLVRAEIYLSVCKIGEQVSQLQRKHLLRVLKTDNLHQTRYQTYQWYQSATRYDPFNMDIHYGIARNRALGGNIEGAVAYLQKTSRKMTENPRPFYAMAKIHYNQGNFRKAQKRLQKAIDLDNKFFPAYYLMLECFEEQDKQNGLKKIFEKISGNDKISKEKFLLEARETFESPVFETEVDLRKYNMIKYFY